MSASASIQLAIATALAAPGALRVSAAVAGPEVITTGTVMPIVARREKEKSAEIEAAAAIQGGLCIFAMPPLPRRAEQNVSCIFFGDAEFRVRIIETPSNNPFGVSAYTLLDDVAQALQWNFLGGLLSGPLQLAPRVVDRHEVGANYRVLDCLFSGAYRLPGAMPAAAPLTLAGVSAMADLQAAVVAQLAPSLATALPIVPLLDKELGSQIEQGGHPLSVQVQPPLPTRAMQGLDSVFYEAAEIRVRITEYPPVNTLEVDAYDVIEEVALALHWQPFEGLLAKPLQIAANPTELREDPESLSKREIDVLFDAAFGVF